MCERFHCLPSQLEEEDSEIIRLLQIVEMGSRRETMEEGDDFG